MLSADTRRLGENQTRYQLEEEEEEYQSKTMVVVSIAANLIKFLAPKVLIAMQPEFASAG
jgi:hypothetical protein